VIAVVARASPRAAAYGHHLYAALLDTGGSSDGGTAGDGFEAAEPTAVALHPVGHRPHVADLASQPIDAAVHLPVEDERHRHPRTDVEVRDIRLADPSAAISSPKAPP
jgi:hypothetical protein